jgi:serine phosphatase RsbU (regulator of sigma subunit)
MAPAHEDEDPALVERSFRQAPFSLSVFDAQQRYLHPNDTACEVMGMADEALRGRVYPYGIPDDVSQHGTLQALRDVVETGEPVHYESFTRAPSGIKEHAWNLELWPIRDEAGAVCAVGMAGFDSSEQHWARQRLAVLDEAAVTIGRTLDLERTAQELSELVVPRFADFAAVDLLEEVLRGEDPGDGRPNGSVVLRRVAHRSGELGFPESAVALGGSDEYPPHSPPARALRLGQPVLSAGTGDPDFDRWVAGDPERAARTEGSPITSLMAMPLIARGTTLGVALLVRTRQDGFTRDDFTLARELAGRAALCVDNARRYTRERTTALALQASLLPHGPSRHSAVDVASRYRPADSRAGVGGDWFDVIPLSGARVALVVGDVVGHGIQASATMGRLRTAVQTLADVDLPPDELLAHLDDLVLRLGGDEERDGPRSGLSEIGATCLYAVYDPVSGTLSAASAGHPPPVLVLPDGETRTVEISVGPVLGVGGLPFEPVELEVPEGSLVALYSDGLVESGDHDPDRGIDRLRLVLAQSSGSLEERCDQLLGAMLPDHPTDDAALVLARTKALHADHVRIWDLPADGAVVAEARRLATAQALICEVSDGSSTSPHLRRARTLDEGGRGLLLVAQLTKNWGTRHTLSGKTIWTEQSLRPGPIDFGEIPSL